MGGRRREEARDDLVPLNGIAVGKKGVAKRGDNRSGDYPKRLTHCWRYISCVGLYGIVRSSTRHPRDWTPRW